MANKGYEDKLYDAISYIAKDVVNKADFDKTVQATIVECVDSALGKYTVKYQDATFYAYSDNINILYSAGTSVYVLIPGNDTSRDKTILGSVKKLGTDYIQAIDNQQKYEVFGEAIIEDEDIRSFSSYKTEIYYYPLRPIFNYDNLIRYFKEENAEYIKISGDFWSNIPLEQQKGGNFGIRMSLQFKDNASGKSYSKNYSLDINNIEGNPYKINRDDGNGLTHFSVYYKIDGKNLEFVDNVRTFVEWFPIQDEEKAKVNDVTIGNIKLEAAKLITEEELNTYSLSLLTPKGVYLDNSHNSVDIQAKIKIRGREIDSATQNIKYYWFRENAGVKASDLKYNEYGGFGWECLNAYNQINSETTVVEWTPGQSVLTLTAASVIAKKVKYKCVAIYGNNKIEKEIYIYNQNSSYSITLESDSGIEFFYDIGTPNLTAKVNGNEETGDAYTYYWGVEDSSGKFTTLVENAIDNEHYNEIVTELNQLKEDIANEIKMPNAEAEHLAYLEAQKDYYDNLARVEKNKIYKVQVNTITGYATYKVSVYNSGIYIGSASITLTNKIDGEEKYNLVIDNNSQIFKYSAAGATPVVNLSYGVEPLTFKMYNSLGEKVDNEYIIKENITWKVPLINTMIKINKDLVPFEKDSDYAYYHEYTLNYSILEEYHYNYKNNIVELEVKYKDNVLKEQKEILFVKDGESGTNGTDYVCKISPNTSTDLGDITPALVNGQPNFEPAQSGQWFKVDIWDKGKLIFSSSKSGVSSDGKSVTLKWGFLRNKYKDNVEDEGDVFYDSQMGFYAHQGYYFPGGNIINIVKCEIKIQNKVQYATFPLVTAYIVNGDIDNISLYKNSGFQYVTYSSDGTTPFYDNSNPFKLKITRKINDIEEDLSETYINYITRCTWSVIGRRYSEKNHDFINEINLFEDNSSSASLKLNEKSFYPSAIYNTETVNNQIRCYVNINNVFIGIIVIPVHFMLDRYGFEELNAWDGNSVQIEEQGGFILSPQVGAGQKESDNSFTGILMGKVKEVGQKEYYNGLHGFNHGQKTIFLNSENGSAIFGKAGGGRIIIDPTTNQALLYTDSFWNSTKENGLPDTDYSFDPVTKKYNNQSNQGMLIDLSAPRIVFGSGNFRIDEDGKVTAEGGIIAGVKIEGDIESVDKKTTEGNPYFTLNSADGAIYSNSKRNLTDTIKGFHLSHAGFGMGAYDSTSGHNPFEVSIEGILYCKSGQIGPVTFTNSSFNYGNTALTNGGISNSNGTWSITSTGTSNFSSVTTNSLSATAGTVGNWNFNNNGLEKGTNYIYTNGDFNIGNNDVWITINSVAHSIDIAGEDWDKIIFRNTTSGKVVTLQDIIDATGITPR